MNKKLLMVLWLSIITTFSVIGQTMDSSIDRTNISIYNPLSSPFIMLSNDGTIEIHGDTIECIRLLFRELKKRTDELLLTETILKYITLDGAVPIRYKKQFDEAVAEYLKNKNKQQ